MAIVVTVSPVPINRTHQPAAVVSDCASKSILRTVVHGLMGANLPNLYYLPSFEMVRWLGSHVQEPMYGKDDDLHRHVNNDMVALIARLFLKHYAA